MNLRQLCECNAQKDQQKQLNVPPASRAYNSIYSDLDSLTRHHTFKIVYNMTPFFCKRMPPEGVTRTEPVVTRPVPYRGNNAYASSGRDPSGLTPGSGLLFAPHYRLSLLDSCC